MAVAVDPGKAKHGQVLFEENCVACHQEGGVGQPGVAPSLTSKEFLSAASDRFIRETVRDGRADTNMAAFGEYLKMEDIDSIVAYLRSNQQTPARGEMLDAEGQAMGDPRLGKRWFEQVCAGCHGARGEGYAGMGSSGTAIGKPGFLSKASDGYIRAIVKNGRSNTPMRPFQGPWGLANLSNQEIDDIIAYLRVLQ